jgi:hypothetical protein
MKNQMLDDFDTQIQCEELHGEFQPSEEDYAPGPDTDEEDDLIDEDEEDDLDFDPDDDIIAKQDWRHDDLSDWFTDDGGLTADAYEWLAEKDLQKQFC